MDSTADIILLQQCVPLSARITVRQCAINRKRGTYACNNCPGLGDEIVELVQIKEEVMAGPKHPKCIVEGCQKIRVAKCDGMCSADFKKYGSREAYYASVEKQKIPATGETEQVPATRGVSPISEVMDMVKRADQLIADQPLDKLESEASETDSIPPRSSFLSLVSAIPAPIPPMSILVDFTGHEELFAAVTANSEDISAGIIELVQLFMNDKLRKVS